MAVRACRDLQTAPQITASSPRPTASAACSWPVTLIPSSPISPPSISRSASSPTSAATGSPSTSYGSAEVDGARHGEDDHRLTLTGSTIAAQTGVSIGRQISTYATSWSATASPRCGSTRRPRRHRDGAASTGGQMGSSYSRRDHVVLRDLIIDDVANNAFDVEPGRAIGGGRISGGRTGIDAEAATIISGTRSAGQRLDPVPGRHRWSRPTSVDVSAPTYRRHRAATAALRPDRLPGQRAGGASTGRPVPGTATPRPAAASTCST